MIKRHSWDESRTVYCFVLYSSVQFNIALKSQQKLMFACEDPKQSHCFNFKDHLISVQLSCSIYHSRSDTPKLPSVHSSEGKGRVVNVLSRLWCIPLGRSNISRLVLLVWSWASVLSTFTLPRFLTALIANSWSPFILNIHYNVFKCSSQSACNIWMRTDSEITQRTALFSITFYYLVWKVLALFNVVITWKYCHRVYMANIYAISLIWI